jgi:hypothetical protein
MISGTLYRYRTVCIYYRFRTYGYSLVKNIYRYFNLDPHVVEFVFGFISGPTHYVPIPGISSCDPKSFKVKFKKFYFLSTQLEKKELIERIFVFVFYFYYV